MTATVQCRPDPTPSKPVLGSCLPGSFDRVGSSLIHDRPRPSVATALARQRAESRSDRSLPPHQDHRKAKPPQSVRSRPGTIPPGRQAVGQAGIQRAETGSPSLLKIEGPLCGGTPVRARRSKIVANADDTWGRFVGHIATLCPDPPDWRHIAIKAIYSPSLASKSRLFG